MNMESNNKWFKIREATPKDDSYIAHGILEAVGVKICEDFAGSKERLPLLNHLFTILAGLEDSQYSYHNTLIAELEDGTIAGLIISYDGANLYTLRQRFIHEANQILGYSIKPEDMSDETIPGEIYLDTLCVFDPYKNKGIGRELLKSAIEKHMPTTKPFGLLVDKTNFKATNLYLKVGFVNDGERPFAGEMMYHLRYDKHL